MRTLVVLTIFVVCMNSVQAAQPLVAVHDSELTRALESRPAAASTPGGTGFEWWPTQWHYFVMPESVKEALRSDGTAYAVVSDADISAGHLLDGDGQPRYPILISLAAEAIRDDEVAPLTQYVAAGGFLLVGSSAFTRGPDGATRGDFALANAMGVHLASASLQNWTTNKTFTKAQDHRLINHIPGGTLNWQMPSASEEIPWGISPDHPLPDSHLIWRVQPSDAVVIAQGDGSPYLMVKPYGRGHFIYHAGMQPLIGHGGFAPGMYSYAIFRKAIEWAFEARATPIAKLSPWPYDYDAAFVVRHDMENYQDQIANIETSAQYEHSQGVRGDYYLCTGTVREEMGETVAAAVIASLRRAVTDYGATIGPHNGGLRNPNNPSLVLGNYDYWHWGLDEALDVPPANLPGGYANGAAYALASLSNAFADVEGWLAGLATGPRVWVSPFFSSTRDGSYAIEEQLNIRVSGEQKLTPFPSWVVSTALPTANKRYPFITLPVSDWYVGDIVAQSLEPHTSQSMQSAVDYFYSLGALINLYSHNTSAHNNYVGAYIQYCTGKARLWAANATSLYQWCASRSSATISPTHTTNGNHTITTLAITGVSNPQTAVEIFIPQSSFTGLQVFLNGSPAPASSYRTSGQVVKVRVDTTVNQVEVRYGS